jgi:hypothetical protein
MLKTALTKTQGPVMIGSYPQVSEQVKRDTERTVWSAHELRSHSSQSAAQGDEYNL